MAGVQRGQCCACLHGRLSQGTEEGGKEDDETRLDKERKEREGRRKERKVNRVRNGEYEK